MVNEPLNAGRCRPRNELVSNFPSGHYRNPGMPHDQAHRRPNLLVSRSKSRQSVLLDARPVVDDR